MRIGDIPYHTPFDDGAADRAREFCRTRKLTADDVKITNKDGMVSVVVKRNGAVCGE